MIDRQNLCLCSCCSVGSVEKMNVNKALERALNLIGTAVLWGIPALTAVRGNYADAWTGFSGDLGGWLPIARNDLLSWIGVLRGTSDVA